MVHTSVVKISSTLRTAEELAAWAIKVAQAPDRVVELTSGVGINNFVEEMKVGL